MGRRVSISEIGNTAVVLCAILVTGAVVKHEFFPSQSQPVLETTKLSMEQWNGVISKGRRIGSATAPVTIVEFSDFECPACRSFSTGPLKLIRAAYPAEVSVLFRHWPLAYHHNAYPAARAAECAAAQGRFAQFHDLVYSQQDSLGLKTFSQFAIDAGVADSAAFNRCNETQGFVKGVDDDIKEVTDLGGKGTPTIVINGVQLASPPDSATLDRLVHSALKAAKR